MSTGYLEYCIRIFGSYTVILKARKLKVDVNDSIPGAAEKLLGYLDIRITKVTPPSERS